MGCPVSLGVIGCHLIHQSIVKGIEASFMMTLLAPIVRGSFDKGLICIVILKKLA